MLFLFCFIVEVVQKHWKSLRSQFTREHRSQKAYEPSGTGNSNLKRPRKTWYLYETLLFLAPHISHRKTCSNFIRKKTESSSVPSTSRKSQSIPPSHFESVPTYTCDIDINDDNSNTSTCTSETSSLQCAVNIKREKLLSPPPDKSVLRKIKDCSKEQDAIYKVIGDTNDVLKNAVTLLSDKPAKSTNEEDVMIKSITCALKKVDIQFSMQCHIDCLKCIQKYQNVEVVFNGWYRFIYSISLNIFLLCNFNT